MADDTPFVLAQAPAQTPPKDLRHLTPDETAKPEVPRAPTRPQAATGRRPLFRN
jgi:hypothetical protein